jgi:hypothetical protein
LKAKLEIAFPLTIAIFAAVLALNDLFSGKYGSDEIKLSNERNNSYQWYQSKGIKSTIVEGQLDLLQILVKTGSIEAAKREGIDQMIRELSTQVDRYDREKKEILLGSSQLKPEEWIQDIDGQLGKVIGGKEYDSHLITLGEAASYFDLAAMLFQICLVIGAIGIMMNQANLKWIFFNSTLATGVTGSILSLKGILIALTIPLL